MPWAVRSWLVLAALLLAGCDAHAEELSRFACTCSFLTDTDGTSHQQVEICAKRSARADQEAKGCAQTGVPATVQSCQCQPRAEPCSRELCQLQAPGP
jgi:hypothetical protein